MNRKLSHNTGAFERLTPESLYWLGMLATDGNVHQYKTWSPCITLVLKDRDHVDKFRSFFSLVK